MARPHNQPPDRYACRDRRSSAVNGLQDEYGRVIWPRPGCPPPPRRARPESGVPDEQNAALRAIFASRITRIEAPIDRACAHADERAYPTAFWRVAAELLATERQALAQLTGYSPAISQRAEHDLPAEQDQLVGTTTVHDR